MYFSSCISLPQEAHAGPEAQLGFKLGPVPEEFHSTNILRSSLVCLERTPTAFGLESSTAPIASAPPPCLDGVLFLRLFYALIPLRVYPNLL
jgi:hypothetical protein